MAETIAEARRTRTMGGNLVLEDRTNPVNKFSCQKCHVEMFFRWFAALRSWPYHCQEPVNYHGPVRGKKRR